MRITTDKSKTREENKEEVKAIVRNMCLMDDDFMSVVLQHRECLELVLNIILERSDLRVKSCKSQYVVSSLYGRSVRLDVYAEDEDGKLYDIEVQNIVSDEEIKRIRFYSALMDANYLAKSEKPHCLPETYVIFILGEDMYNDGLPVYHVDRTVRETGKIFEDDLHIILVNSQVRTDTALGKLMSDFHCREPK
ncbi:MAG: Rpn family recombination-promoting nuclease/putative transposase, partial [Bacteroides sp.]|nr:Rpn family recombination-promoting nuclease/putative transposase [Bacteroides sp.]